MRLENEKNLEYLLGQHFAKNFSHDIIYKKNNQNKFGQKINQLVIKYFYVRLFNKITKRDLEQ